MPPEAVREFSNPDRSVLTDASQSLARESIMNVPSINEDARRAVIAVQTQDLRDAGILPEFAIEGPPLNPARRGGAVENHAYAKLEGRVEENFETYMVQKGDNLWGICRQHLQKENGKEPTQQEVKRLVQDVVQENKIKNADLIHPGDEIRLHAKASDSASSGEKEPVKKEPEKTPEKTSEKPTETDTAKPAAEAKYATSELDLVRSKFAGIDADKNDHITKQEIDAFIKENRKTLTVAEAESLQKVANNQERLQSQVDENGSKTPGITRQDIDTAESRMKAYEYASKWFFAIDKGDFRGHITRNEIDDFVKARPDLSAEDRASLELLKNEMESIQAKHKKYGIVDSIYPGFTRRDLQVALKQIGCETFSEEERLQQSEQKQGH